MMSQRTASGPSFEMVPRDQPVTRGHAVEDAAGALQLGQRLQRLYPCIDHEPESMKMLIVALDRKLQKR